MPPILPASHRPKPSIAVVIPTFNRVDALRQCLRHLERQTFQDFAVIVVDDGSTDQTRDELARYASTADFDFEAIELLNRGPARARNRGIQVASAPVTVLIGDDTFPQEDFLERHHRFHCEHPELEAVAIGLTRWAAEGQTITPLMKWLEREGVQFNFGELLNGKPASWRHFYTSNLSAKTSYLQQHPFDETFQSYGLEDIELGYRLSKRNDLQVTFLPEAVVEHLHPVDFTQSCRRALIVGASEYRLGEIWPEHRPILKGTKQRLLRLFCHPMLLPWWRRMAALSIAVWFPNPLVPRALQLHRMRGYLDAIANARSRLGAVEKGYKTE